jgi:hypothetical protein
MEAQPAVMKKALFYKRMLYYINIPLIVGIPIFVHFGLPVSLTKDINTIYALLHLTDFFICFNSFIMYSFLSKLVTSIIYMPEEHKLKLK